MSYNESQAAGQSKEALEIKLFHAFPAEESTNTHGGRAVFTLEFLPKGIIGHCFFCFQKGITNMLSDTNTTSDLILLSLSKMFSLMS